jgi:FkbM family methyltransferase
MPGALEALRARMRQVPLAAFFYHRLREALAPFAPAVTTPYGFRLAGNAAMQKGGFEREEVELVRALLAERDVLVDIGANIGLYTCLARSVGKQAVAVEPHPANLRLLRANLAQNGWRDNEIAAVGLSETAGEAELLGSDTGASLVSGWAGLSRRTLLRHRIRLSTLDALLRERFAGKRLLVKIDIEGAELSCLRGALRTLERTPAPAWLVEICLTENFPGGRNPDFLASFDMFFSRGYRAFTANAARAPVSREQAASWARQGRSESGTYNYLFLR